MSQVIIGDALEELRKLPTGSIHCCVTSPPYWGLRDYGVPGQYGSEPTLEAYIARQVEVFHEVRRVLRADGTCWINMGDGYWGGKGKSAAAWSKEHPDRDNTLQAAHHHPKGRGETRPQDGKHPTLKPKDLIGQPWRLAFALQADGWYLRSDIIWAKPSPKPESVSDRPTAMHEHVFLLTKSRRYYYDQEAVREPATNRASGNKIMKTGQDIGRPGSHIGNSIPWSGSRKRNARTVWTITPAHFDGAHFATFPRRLAEIPILAGSSAFGACPICGAPWKRIVKKEAYTTRPNSGGIRGFLPCHHVSPGTSVQRSSWCCETETTGWEPTCRCADGIDRRIVTSPTGKNSGPDPSLQTGRGGLNRPRNIGEGTRPITRHEQARYAEQLIQSPNRIQMEWQAGAPFKHYIRTDSAGARPIPPDLLAAWISNGWLEQVLVPPISQILATHPPVPCVILDPYGGSGTVAEVATSSGREYIIIDLDPRCTGWTDKRLALAAQRKAAPPKTSKPMIPAAAQAHLEIQTALDFACTPGGI